MVVGGRGAEGGVARLRETLEGGCSGGGGWVVLHQLQVGLSGWERRAAWMSVLVSFLVTVAVGGKLRKSLTYDDVFDGVLCSDAMIERGRRDVEADVLQSYCYCQQCEEFCVHALKVSSHRSKVDLLLANQASGCEHASLCTALPYRKLRRGRHCRIMFYCVYKEEKAIMDLGSITLQPMLYCSLYSMYYTSLI